MISCSTVVLRGGRVAHATFGRDEHPRCMRGAARPAYMVGRPVPIPKIRDGQVPHSQCRVGGVGGAASGVALRRRGDTFQVAKRAGSTHTWQRTVYVLADIVTPASRESPRRCDVSRKPRDAA